MDPGIKVSLDDGGRFVEGSTLSKITSITILQLLHCVSFIYYFYLTIKYTEGHSYTYIYTTLTENIEYIRTREEKEDVYTYNNDG